MQGQLARLPAAAAEPRISVQVLPFDQDEHEVLEMDAESLVDVRPNESHTEKLSRSAGLQRISVCRPCGTRAAPCPVPHYAMPTTVIAVTSRRGRRPDDKGWGDPH